MAVAGLNVHVLSMQECIFLCRLQSTLTYAMALHMRTWHLRILHKSGSLLFLIFCRYIGVPLI